LRDADDVPFAPSSSGTLFPPVLPARGPCRPSRTGDWPLSLLSSLSEEEPFLAFLGRSFPSVEKIFPTPPLTCLVSYVCEKFFLGLALSPDTRVIVLFFFPAAFGPRWLTLQFHLVNLLRDPSPLLRSPSSPCGLVQMFLLIAPHDDSSSSLLYEMLLFR